MKIIQLVTRPQHRGAEIFAATLSSTLATRGHTVLFVALYPALGDQVTAKGCENLVLSKATGRFSWRLLRALIHLIKQEEPCVIQANGSDTLKYAVLASLLGGRRFALVYRNISMASQWVRKGSIKHRLYKFFFKRVDFVASVGANTLRDFTTLYNYPEDRAMQVRRGVVREPVNRALSHADITARFDWPADARLLVHVGQFSPEKNQTFLVEMFPQVLLSVPDARLVLVGKGKLMQQVMSRAAELGLHDKVGFTGHQDNVQSILACAELFCLCSKIEGLPGVVLESSLHEVPTVAVNVGSVGEVVQNGRTGILLSQHDGFLFAKSIVRLLEDPAMRELLGRQARQLVEERFGIESCVEQFEAIYQMVKK